MSENTFQDHLIIPTPNLEISDPPMNVVDSPCIVEGDQVYLSCIFGSSCCSGSYALRQYPHQIHVLPQCLLLHSPRKLHLNLRSHDYLVLINLSVC